MQLIEVTPRDGYVWFRQGLWLFRKNPLTFLMLLFIYLMALQLAIFIPLIGIIAALVLNPGLFVGIMTACREVIQNRRVSPTILVSAFRTGDKTAVRGLLKLGGLYALAVFLLSLLVGSLIDLRELMPVLLRETEPTAETANIMYRALVIGGLLYIPVAMMFWFAPLLVAWHGVTPGKAIFFSWIACWRNRGAFLIFGLIFGGLMVAVPFFLEALFRLFGAGDFMSFLLTPYSLAMLTILYCAFYATYRGCFNVKSVTEPESSDPTEPVGD
jgi:hypothetical protein